MAASANANHSMDMEKVEEESFDYSQRAQWIRAAVLGANDGLVTIASLMMGIGAVKDDARAMVLTGFAGLFAGSCSMAIGEFVSVYSQRDIQVAQMKRVERGSSSTVADAVGDDEVVEEKLPNPFQAALASAVAFSMGAVVPLLAAAFVREYKVRLGVVAAATTAALVGFGWVGAAMGGTRRRAGRWCGRAVVGGWMAMGITFGLSKLIGSRGGGLDEM